MTHSSFVRSFCILPVLILFFVGCEGSRSLSGRETGALAGGALGAGLGAIVGHQLGSSGAGTAIGGAAGALSGALVGNAYDEDKERLDEREKIISRQQRELEENRRILEELRANGADARQTDRGILVNLPDVLFEFNSARLTSEAVRTARDIARVAKRAEGRRISIEGHTDSVGTMAYNQRLSVDRAESVARELENEGVSSRRMNVKGYGETRPIASNATDSGRRKNRRVEVIIENRERSDRPN